jgi:hypothetical protein
LLYRFPTGECSRTNRANVTDTPRRPFGFEKGDFSHG